MANTILKVPQVKLKAPTSLKGSKPLKGFFGAIVGLAVLSAIFNR